ncbi:MAG: HAMP domain-containing histidine kinase [Lachnospiraceae bacterium]|nr:HAMP domain-containing histidine kinase [Lachnospiraceae bacterium]
MKFRYKVLIINLTLLSISLGIIGYLMIRKNFALAQNTQLQNAIVENNLVQSSVEYELLQVLNSENYNIEEELSEIGERVAGGMMAANSSFYIKYGNEYVYSGDGNEAGISEELFSNLDTGGKNYLISREEGSHYIYVTSYSNVNEKSLCIISKRDISESYLLMNQEIVYFRFLIIGILMAASLIMYGVSRYLTRPLEKLNQVSDEIAEGNYDTRIEVKTNDEVGLLAEKFNHMAEAVSEHVEELNDMIRRRDQFVADFTHEIKTPMTTIIGYADTMRSMELPREEEIMSLNYIFSEGKRLETMSGKLFQLIYLKQNEIEKTKLHTTDLGKEIVKIVSPALLKKKICLVTDIEPAVLEGSQELLVTVFINLIDNARKASREGDTIEFAGCCTMQQESDASKANVQKENGTGYEFTVTDHGVGMSEDDVEKICDEFYMVDKSRSRREGGAGLGMSLVALILEKHGAELVIESKLGEGTRMRVIFSLEETQADSES